MEQSILKSTKKVLHVGPDDQTFDLDIMTHINSAFSTLFDVGVGPAGGFQVQDEEAVWTDFVADDVVQINQVKTYVLLTVRLGFDPPETSYLLSAVEKQRDELLHRLSMRRENEEWVDPDPTSVSDDL